MSSWGFSWQHLQGPEDVVKIFKHTDPNYLCTNSFRELLALLPRHIYGEVLASFIWDFLTLGSGNLLFHFFGDLLTVFLWDLEEEKGTIFLKLVLTFSHS